MASHTRCETPLNRMPFRRDPKSSRGQALVEMAVVLPLLVLMLVMTLDFGRVFFGWVALQNATRIGADRASQTAAAWPTANGNDEVIARDEYESQITNDLIAANCTPASPLPDPTFTDYDGNDEVYDFGDLVTVQLTCEFGLITPLAETILGGPVTLSATSTFAQHGVVVLGIPDAPPLACQAPNASFVTNPEANAAGGNRLDGIDLQPTSLEEGFTVIFTDSSNVPSGCTATNYVWTFEDGSASGPNMTTVSHVFNHSGPGFTDYTVTLTITNERGGPDSATLTVRVRQ